MATRTILLLALAAQFLCSVVPVSGAMAQDTSAGEAQARRLYRLGSDAFDAERFSEAAVYFLEAYHVTPLPELLFNAGVAHQRGEEDAEAIDIFERYLENHPGESDEAEANARLVVLRRRVADQGLSGPTPNSTPSATPNASDGADIPAPDQSDSASPSRVVPLTLIIGGALTAAAGATFLIVAGGARSNVEDASGFYSDVEADDSRASTFGLLGGVALGVGAALAGVGVVLWATSSGDREDENEDAHSGLRVGLGHAEWSTSW